MENPEMVIYEARGDQHRLRDSYNEGEWVGLSFPAKFGEYRVIRGVLIIQEPGYLRRVGKIDPVYV